MANTIDWGKASVNNTNGYGKGAIDNTIRWGKIYESSASGDTNIGTATTPSFSNTKSIVFDGIDMYVETQSTYSELNGQNKATFSAWINPTATNVLGVILHTPRNTGASDSQFQILIDNANRLRFNIQDTGTHIFSNTGVFTAGSWSHILVCYDGSSSAPSNSPQRGQIFIDGIDQTSVVNLNITSLPTSTGELSIGEHSQGFWNPFSGKMDEVAIWSGTDLRNDVATLYNSGVPNDLNNNGLTAPTSWYRFEEGSGTTISDSGSSTNNAVIENPNAVNFSTDVPT